MHRAFILADAEMSLQHAEDYLHYAGSPWPTEAEHCDVQAAVHLLHIARAAVVREMLAAERAE